MKKYFIVSDVHSFYNELVFALNKSGFDKNNKNHIFVSLGDLLDRGNQSRECLEFVNSLPTNRKILVRGNHEDLLEQCCTNHEYSYHHLSNGTYKTIAQLCNVNYEEMLNNQSLLRECQMRIFDMKIIKDYYECLVDYAEIGDYVLCHGYVPLTRNIKMSGYCYSINKNWKNGDWKNARWINGLSEWQQGNILDNKTIIVGHCHTSYIRKQMGVIKEEFAEPKRPQDFDIFEAKGIVALDGCAYWSGKLNCKTIEI